MAKMSFKLTHGLVQISSSRSMKVARFPFLSNCTCHLYAFHIWDGPGLYIAGIVNGGRFGLVGEVGFILPFLINDVSLSPSHLLFQSNPIEI